MKIVVCVKKWTGHNYDTARVEIDGVQELAEAILALLHKAEDLRVE